MYYIVSMKPNIIHTEDGLYRVIDYTATGYVDRTTASAQQDFVTYWRVDTATNEFSLEKVLFGWRESNEENMEDVTAQFLYPENFYFPTKEEKHSFVKRKDKPVVHLFYNTIRKAIGRHRKQLMIHLKLIEPPVAKEKKSFIVVTMYGRQAYIEHGVETDRLIGTMRKSNIAWIPWSLERDNLMHAYNTALHEAGILKTALFVKEEKPD